MAKIIKKSIIRRGNVTTVYKNNDSILGNTTAYPGLEKSVKDLKQRPVKRSHNPHKRIGNI